MNQKTKGILCILSAAFFFACMSAFIKSAGDLPSLQKAFFRNIVAVIFAFSVLRKEHLSLRLNPEHRFPLFMRATVGTIGIISNFYAVDHMLLADANILNKLSPFFAILMSFFILRERISLFQGGCIITAFIGSLLVVKPGIIGAPFIPAMIGLLGGFTAGTAYTFVRLLGKRGLKGPVIVFYFSAFSSVVLLPNLILDYHPMTVLQLLSLIAAGLCAAGGQFSITAAYTYAPAREISVYDYSQVLFSALLGMLFFGQLPDRWSVLGYIIIVGVAVIMFLKQRREPA